MYTGQVYTCCGYVLQSSMLKCLFTNGSEDTTLKVIPNIDGKYRGKNICKLCQSHYLWYFSLIDNYKMFKLTGNVSILYFR